MAFKVAARVILELGAELISSDSIALYELVKNSVDAGSERVSIEIQVVLKKSRFLQLIEDVSEGMAVKKVRRTLLSSLEPAAPATAKQEFENFILSAGDDPEDFRQALCDAYRDHNWIKIKDYGHGMTREELEENFLLIGTRSRRREKIDEFGNFVDPGRTVLGDKGVGRLSAMRLGDWMTVITSSSGEPYQNILEIDWNRFSHESVDMIEDVDIHPRKGKRKRRRLDQGTTIFIRDLRADWDATIFSRMIEEQFKRIIDPFPSSRSVAGWRDPNDLFCLCFNGKRSYVPEVPTWLLEQAHAVVTARYEVLEGKKPRLRGDINYKLRGTEKQFEQSEAELISLTNTVADRNIRTSRKTLRKLGPFSVQFYWYNRRLLKEVEGIGKRREIVEKVNSWAGGLMVFRDFFRINPYGGQDDDWLELDKKALAAGGYKVNRSQIIGQVSLSSHNLHLIEQTNREGLVDNEYKQALTSILLHIIITEFRSFIDEVDKERRVSDEITTDNLEQQIEEATSTIDKIILQLIREVPGQKKSLRKLRRLAFNLGQVVEQAKTMAKEYEDDRSKFVYLAGIGLMVEFILHEIGRTVTRVLDVLSSVDMSQFDEGASSALQILQGQLVTLGKRVDTLDPISTSRRQVKQSFNVGDVVHQVISGRSQQFARHGIEVIINLPKRPYKIKAVRGMFLQILENLFENSVYWLNIESHRRRRFEPQIKVTVDLGASEIIFCDNGPGIAVERAEKIFEPFVTSKPPGQGKGLGLYISREMAKYHDWNLSLSLDELNEDERSSTFVLEMS